MVSGESENFEGGAVHGKKQTVDTSDGAERKRNQKYGANRVARTLILLEVNFDK